VPGDAAATAGNIIIHLLTYRLGIASDIVGQVFLILLSLTLYGLLKDADKRYARAMVTLVVVGVAFEIANVLNLIAPLNLLTGAGFLAPFTKPQLAALALGALQLRTRRGLRLR
jgi:hypothetical protein